VGNYWGVTAAILTIPVSMTFGALAVHGSAHGILASLYRAVMVPIVAPRPRLSTARAACWPR